MQVKQMLSTHLRWAKKKKVFKIRNLTLIYGACLHKNAEG